MMKTDYNASKWAKKGKSEFRRKRALALLA
jgi:hypothetical protein